MIKFSKIQLKENNKDSDRQGELHNHAPVHFDEWQVVINKCV
jgi:hypothetical protein